MHLRNWPTLSSAPFSSSVLECRDALTHLQEVSESRSTKLARSLHDDIGGLLISAVMDLGWITRHPACPAELQERLGRVTHSLTNAVQLQRDMIEELRPSLLDDIGLFAALRWHLEHKCSQETTRCHWHFPAEEIPMHALAATGLFRIVQEALAMVFSEPRVKQLDIELSVAEHSSLVELSHEHQGEESIDMLAHSLDDMRSLIHRITSLHGQYAVQRHSTGSVLRCAFPLSRIRKN
jgi:signal transduction histidine kinase